MEIFGITLELLRRFVHRAGPYLLIEAVLPGGTLVALLLYLYRSRSATGNGTLTYTVDGVNAGKAVTGQTF